MVAIGASAVLHVGLLVGLLLYRPVLLIPVEPAGPPEAIIPILLMPRVPPAAAAGRPEAASPHSALCRAAPGGDAVGDRNAG